MMIQYILLEVGFLPRCPSPFHQIADDDEVGGDPSNAIASLRRSNGDKDVCKRNIPVFASYPAINMMYPFHSRAKAPFKGQDNNIQPSQKDLFLLPTSNK